MHLLHILGARNVMFYKIVWRMIGRQQIGER